ncbi:uncharacterized protein Z518_05314 [Rhinocladiella mackenziei CBS 650.93]|uniref:Pre-rRNA-processing protein ESF2 n=1 Tax=Rhinocladiella mackenziei CBS 650.93 TaxID=1442369 RepID=A0A0D2IMT7_9EURO|nr:uncharacterized protein Z518_05314 [Rhinocladiella mackenziei CBS 650.93]KIX04446.1 hypothetical protein Z518_05314 [Rhinocladiella mackenziei CBS 650.93]
MSLEKRNVYLDHDSSDESDHDAGYDSEAAEVSKAGRASKRRKIELEYTDDEGDEIEADTVLAKDPAAAVLANAAENDEAVDADARSENDDDPVAGLPQPSEATDSQTKRQKKEKDKTQSKPKGETPGVVYLSSLPPYLKPSALRNLLEQRGFGPIKRLFLSPASKHKSSSKKNSRQLYTEGWIEFASKSTARRCAETLNAQLVGGRKGGFYHDDVWNMKYLRGMRWEELMAGVREEKREEEGRRDEERRIIARETKRFIEGVEEGRRREGIKRTRERRGNTRGDVDGEAKRTWRQAEVKGQNPGRKGDEREKIGDEVKQVLGKIF